MSNLGASTKLSATSGGGNNNNNKRLAPPSPSPSNASNTSKTDGTPTKRQKREGGIAAAAAAKRRGASPTPTPAAMAAANVSYGNDMLTHLTYAVDFLKSKGTSKTLGDIFDHLSLQFNDPQYRQQFSMLMRKHPRIQFTPAPRTAAAAAPPKGKDGKDGSKDGGKEQLPSWAQGKYEFRPKIPGVNSKTTLLAHLQAKTDASALSVKELKDGWPDCDDAIKELEDEHRILAVRTRKDGHAKFVWPDDPRLAHRVDPEFKVMWHRVEIPSVDDIVRKLTAVGQKPASEDPRLKKMDGAGAGAKKPKRRANRGGKPQQNVHMTHLLQDFSGLRK